MNCIAVDDEPLALNVIKEFCREIDFINLVGTYTNAVDAVAEINKKNIDLIFLDVEMPNITGLEFIKSLQSPPLIVLTTAYSKYAINGFELNVLDYFMKHAAFIRNKLIAILFCRIFTTTFMRNHVCPVEEIF